MQLTGDDSAQAFHNAKQARANLPWFLKHRYAEEEIKLDFDGTVKAGTLPALVEHLVVDSLREIRFSALQLSVSNRFVAGASQQETFRRAFLVTFRTFATATEVFDLLVAQFELDAPPDLSEEEFKRWKREKLRPTQKRVLTVLTMSEPGLRSRAETTRFPTCYCHSTRTCIDSEAYVEVSRTSGEFQ